VAAATPSRSDTRAALLAAVLLLAPPAGLADVTTAEAAPEQSPAAFVTDLRAHTPEEVADLLERLEALAAGDGFPSHDPVVMVLHGDEAVAFTRENYGRYRDTVDRAARLEAFGLLDVRICERWMRARGVAQSDLPPFVDTVADGMAEAQRLERAGYLKF
jgi:intracellular sulfur oxidation DsrE/DsrF family protein